MHIYDGSNLPGDCDNDWLITPADSDSRFCTAACRFTST